MRGDSERGSLRLDPRSMLRPPKLSEFRMELPSFDRSMREPRSEGALESELEPRSIRPRCDGLEPGSPKRRHPLPPLSLPPERPEGSDCREPMSELRGDPSMADRPPPTRPSLCLLSAERPSLEPSRRQPSDWPEELDSLRREKPSTERSESGMPRDWLRSAPRTVSADLPEESPKRRQPELALSDEATRPLDSTEAERLPDSPPLTAFSGWRPPRTTDSLPPPPRRSTASTPRVPRSADSPKVRRLTCSMPRRWSSKDTRSTVAGLRRE
jgi:hypothetical protein